MKKIIFLVSAMVTLSFSMNGWIENLWFFDLWDDPVFAGIVDYERNGEVETYKLVISSDSTLYASFDNKIGKVRCWIIDQGTEKALEESYFTALKKRYEAQQEAAKNSEQCRRKALL